VQFYAYRKFAIADETGAIIASADTVWLLVNTATKKPVKINDHMYTAFGVGSDENNPLEFEKLEELSHADIEKEYKVRYSDIDTNRHVNNVKYVDWAIETVPLNTISDYCLTRIKVIYKKEAIYGMSLKVYTQSIPKADGTICLHRIADSDDGVGNVVRDHTSRPDDRPGAHTHAGKQGDVRRHPRVLPVNLDGFYILLKIS
jgi:medium-chain acyl-[acyl-carrier-protein] hydrolase